MTSSVKIVCTGFLFFFSIGFVQAASEQNHQSNNGVNHTVQREKLHPTANLSYKVAGKRYYPSKNADNFVQTGSASWYGPGFHGKRTSSGEKFDMYALTAAHKTLPIPSYVRVTNLSNGKSVVVRINDRGPFHGERVIDLSKGAAKQLGFIRQGFTNVKIEALKAGTPLSEAIVVQNRQNNIDKNIYVDVKTFEKENEAQVFLQATSEYLNKMKATQRAIVVKNNQGYVVKVGPFMEQKQADQTHNSLKQEII